jgi:hypothetical protein
MKVVYYHINNGGVSIGADRCSLVIESGHFGNNLHAMRLDMTPSGMKMLGELLIEHADSLSETRHPDAAEARIVHRNMLTNIATCDDYDYSKEGAAEKDSQLNMSQTKAHPMQSGIIVYDRTDDTYWWVLDREAKQTTAEAVPAGARWTGLKNPEVADMIHNIKD